MTLYIELGVLNLWQSFFSSHQKLKATSIQRIKVSNSMAVFPIYIVRSGVVNFPDSYVGVLASIADKFIYTENSQNKLP